METKYNFVPLSTREMVKTLRYMGSECARIDTPMLHPDHMRTAVIYFRKLADDLEQLAGAKGTNINKVFQARTIFAMVQQALVHAAAHDMQYVRSQDDKPRYSMNERRTATHESPS